MAVTLNAKGTSVPYFKIGKTGITLYQGGNDPHATLGYSVSEHDIWIDTNDKTVKFRTSSNTWDPIADNLSDLTDVDLTGLADGYFLRYNLKIHPHLSSRYHKTVLFYRHHYMDSFSMLL